MTKPSAKSYLLDIGEWQHFTESVLPEWINNRDQYDGAIAATTIDDNLIKPLFAFLEKEDKKVPSSTFVTKGIELLNYLKMDIASKFSNDQTIVIEQVQTLNQLVIEFLAIFGSGEVAKISKTNQDSAKVKWKPRPSYQEVNNFKTDWINDYLLKHGVARKTGWRGLCATKFGITTKMLKEIYP